MSVEEKWASQSMECGGREVKVRSVGEREVKMILCTSGASICVMALVIK